MKKVLLFLFTFLLLTNVYTHAQSRPELSTANMSRAAEAIQNGNNVEAMKYLNQELENNSRNGYAYFWLSVIHHANKEAGKAISMATKALKYIPAKDKTYVIYVYKVRGEVYRDLLDDYNNALADFSKMIVLDSKNQDGYEERAQTYYLMKKYDLSDKDYKKMQALNPSSSIANMGLGRNAYRQERYQDAIDIFTYVIQLYGSDYSTAYSFRGDVYEYLGEYDKAADDIVTALAIDRDQKAWYHLFSLADSAYLTVTSRLKVQKNKEPKEAYWPYVLGTISQHVKKYANAITFYKDAYALDPDAQILYQIADTYHDQGFYSYALEYLDRAILADSSDMSYRFLRAETQFALGNTEAAINEMTKCIEMSPEYYGAYYRRGWYEDHGYDNEKAIEDYSTSISLNPNYSYAYFARGVLFDLEGEKVAAQKDFQKAISLDTVMSKLSCAPYCYYYLGQHEKALQYIDTLLKYEDAQTGNYEAACLHSLLGNKKIAIDHFEKALENGYRNFNHISRDRDLSLISDMPDFKRIVEQYKKKYEEELNVVAEVEGDYEEKEKEIPFERKNGVTEVKCKINNLPLYFVFDTGASDVTISMVEATFMLKNGYLKSTDVVGSKYYMTANGEIAEGTVINLDNVDLGGLSLSNVRASVVKSQTAPLLLGQSVLQRLGKIEIDNAKKVLRVTYKEKK